MRYAETAVYLLGVLALASLAAAVLHGCGAGQTTRPVCDPDVAHRELVLCVAGVALSGGRGRGARQREGGADE